MTPFETLQRQYPWPATMPSCGPKVHGWLQQPKALASKVQGHTCAVELGSWYGLSATCMVEAEPNLHLVCIDHWRGSPEHTDDPTWNILIAESYDRFLANLWPHRDRVVALRANTSLGLALLYSYGYEPTVAYIDAGHDEASVRADIETLLEMWPDILLCGDDYTKHWPGVVTAVDALAALYNVTVDVEGNLWSYRRRQP